jgi:hypothetical protein
MAPPERTTAGDYHFHVYDYKDSAAWTLSQAQPERDGLKFYSMRRDLISLALTARDNGVPNAATRNIGVEITGGLGQDVLPDKPDGVCHIKALSFGGPTQLSPDTPVAVITGGIHAREWVAAEMAYLLAEYLIVNYSNDPGGNRHKQFIHDLVRTRRIHIIPMLNPSGSLYTVFSAKQTARMWRVNRRTLPNNANGWRDALIDQSNNNPWPPFRNVPPDGDVASYEVPRYPPGHNPVFDTVNLPNRNFVGVDINRNCATRYFGHNAGPDYQKNNTPGNGDYFGMKAGSELETQNIQGFLAGKNIRTSIDYHSYSQLILYPTEVADGGFLYDDFKVLGQTLQALIQDYALGTTKQLLGYDGTGSLADYVGTKFRSRSFVIELDPKKDPNNPGAGFKLAEDKIQGVFENNIRAALALIAAAGEPSTQCPNCLGRHTVSPSERELLGWDVAGRGNRLPA